MPRELETEPPVNPNTITAATVAAIESRFGNNPRYFQPQGHPFFEEMTTPMFQAFRIGEMELTIPITLEDQAKFNLSSNELSSFGDETKQSSDAYDWFTGINSMRSFVWSVFQEQSQRDGSRLKPNEDLIDPQPFKKEQIPHLRAPEKGMLVYERESLEKQWELENPEFYKAMIKLRDRLTDFYATRMLQTYSSLPPEFLAKISLGAHETYRDSFMDYALRTYILFTPIQPELIEVPTC